ncbi:MAG TPA: GIY-YIG nuclease family protein [Nitrospirota bacterium]|nr:GIY-YIG nuclease family protein [Nitrospirota bacterium]
MISLKSKRSAQSRNWILYILLCRDGTLYTGITSDLSRRIRQHNNGSASRYTRCRRPVQCIYHEPCLNHSCAIKRELAVKSLPKKEKEKLINKFR